MRTPVTALASLVTALLLFPPLLEAQERSRLLLQGPSGEDLTVEVTAHRGYATVPLSLFESVGWRVDRGSPEVVLRFGDGPAVELRPGSPFFRWDGQLYQLVEAPYYFGERLFVPLQLATDFLSRRMGDTYAYDAGGALRVLDDRAWTPGGRATARRRAEPPAPIEDDGTSVVVIDPGHGGEDTGALGPAGIREKEIALGVGRALARELREVPGVEVHLTREDDVLVPLWERGEKATRWKGDRPGVFISLHANAVARSSAVRGFETYFLSEARTEDERRVAALENSVVNIEAGGETEAAQSPDLEFIVNDLRNRGHQPWSAELAERVQEELGAVHPGPDRGVKQGPFAVITNALMPSVLVELGFLTHPEEARTLADPDFQAEVAGSIARAVVGFLERYPPGRGATVPGGAR